MCCRAYVLDSASVYLTTSHKEVVSGINAYLTAVLNSSVNLEAEVMQVLLIYAFLNGLYILYVLWSWELYR